MNERIEKIKTHLKEHKKAYLVGTLCLSFAAITRLIMRDNNDDNATLRGASTMIMPPYVAHGLSFSDSAVSGDLNVSDSFNKIVNVLEREGRGHPGYMIRCVEDNLTYPSQLKASIAYNVTPMHMSDHLNGRLDHVDGKHFERVILAA